MMKSKIHEFQKSKLQSMSNTIKLSAIAIIALFTFSCSSDDDKPTVQQAKRVKKEVSVQSGGATNTTTFGYDALGRLLTKTTAAEAITYSRNSVGKIIQAVIVNSGTDRIVTYTYDATGRITEMQKKAGSMVEERTTYSYYIDRIMEKYYNADGDNVWDYIHYYTADKKNIDRVLRNYGGSEVQYSLTTYTYDSKIGLDKVAPYSDMPQPFYNANNPEHFSYRNELNVETSSGNYIYTYDALGFPLTMTDANGTITTYTY
jgi:YD repeat-containing protein